MPETGSAVTSAPSDALEDQVYGLLVVAGRQVALPLSALREVVPCPQELSSLPVSAPGLLGAMELREMVVPVVDLGERLGLISSGAASREGPSTAAGLDEDVVVVVASGDQLLGVLAQAVRGVVRVPASVLMELTAEGGPLLFSHAFRGEDGGIVSVLDPARVVALPGVPTVRDRPRTSADVADDGDAGARTTWTLLRCGEHLLALDVAFVHTTLPGAPPRPSVVDGGLCLGVATYTGVDVPVVDPLRLLGLGSVDPASGADLEAGMVLCLEGGYVVLALSALVGLVDVAAADSMAVPSFSVPRSDLLAGLADLPGHGPCLVLDGQALLADGGLRELASTIVAAAGTTTGAVDGPTSPPTPRPGGESGPEPAAVAQAPIYLTYRAGTPLATRLEQVVEILPLPAPGTLAAASPRPMTGHQAVLGVMAHRGTSLPVLHLPTLLGLTERPGLEEMDGGCLLLVATGGSHLALAVDSLNEIELLTWGRPRSSHGLPRARHRRCPDVTVRRAALQPPHPGRRWREPPARAGPDGSGRVRRGLTHPTPPLPHARPSRPPSPLSPCTLVTFCRSQHARATKGDQSAGG